MGSAKRKVVVVNGFHRTGSTRCFHAVRLVLAQAGIAHAVAKGDMAVLDDIIVRHRSGTDGPDWLVAKSHRWMPRVRDPDVTVLFTERAPRDVAVSLVKARSRLPGPPAEIRARAEALACSEAVWQAFFQHSVADALPIERLRYEDYFGREVDLVGDIARLLGIRLARTDIEAIAAQITPEAGHAHTAAMTEDVDPEWHYRRGHLSDTLGRPGAALPDFASDDLRAALAELERMDRPRPSRPARRTAGPVRLSERQLRFMHMRKTGGTTVARILGDFFDPADTQRWHSGATGKPPADFAARIAEARFVLGHADFLDFGRPDAFRLVFLRDPADRLRSERRQWTQAGEENIAVMPPRLAAHVRDLQARDLKDILGRVRELPELLPSFWNHQTLMLGLAPVRRLTGGEPPFPLPTPNGGLLIARSGTPLEWLHAHADDLLEEAVRRLDRLDMVGIFEDFAASVEDLLDRLGLPQPAGPLPWLNRRAPYADETDPGIGDVLEDFVRLDRRLYAEALSRRRAAGPPTVPRTIPPVTYLDRRLGPGAPVEIAPQDAPNGHGWHHPHVRADGRPARWTTGVAELGLAAATGCYRLRLIVFGGASADSLAEVAVTACGRRIELSLASPADDGTWTIGGEITVAEPGWLNLAILVPAVQGHGLEVAAIRLDPSEPQAEADHLAVSPRPVDLSAVFVDDDLPYFGTRQAAEERVYAWYAGCGATFRPRSILEIGVRRGYGAYALVAGAEGSVARYAGIDMELDIPGSNRAAEVMLRGLGIAEVTLIRADTREFFPSLAGSFDLIHVDGDHSTAGALGDIVHALPLLAPGGILIVDDVETAPVRAAVDMVLAALAGRVTVGEAGDLHRQALIRPRPNAPRLGSVAAVLAAAPAQALGRYRFDLALRALRELDRGRRDESTVAALATDLLQAGRLRLGGAACKAVPDPGRPADAMVAGFVDLFAALSVAAGPARGPHPWEAEFREHGAYALARLDGLAVPDALAGTERLAQAFRSPSPEFGLMLHEFACNLAAIAERALDLVDSGRIG